MEYMPGRLVASESKSLRLVSCVESLMLYRSAMGLCIAVWDSSGDRLALKRRFIVAEKA